MKSWQLVTAGAGVLFLGVGVAMALTNPSQTTYEEYAAQQLTQYMQSNVCPQAPSFLGTSLEGQCRSLLISRQSEIKQIIAQTTQRQNFIILSLYKTDLSVQKLVPFLPANILPAYHFQTVGAFDNFYTYQAQKQ